MSSTARPAEPGWDDPIQFAINPIAQALLDGQAIADKIRGASKAKRLRPLGPDDAPHCRAHVVFRSDCEACASERQFA